MPLNSWFRDHPLVVAVIGIAIAAVGLNRGQPVAIVAGIVLVLSGLASSVR